MNGKDLLLLIIVVIIVLCIFYPSMFKCKKPTAENFETFLDQSLLDKQDVQNPRVFQEQMTAEVDNTPLVGLPSEFMTAWDGGLKYADFDYLNDGMSGNAGMGFNLCSKSCCSPQYPPPFGTAPDNLVCNSKDKFVATSYTCNNGWQDSGCLCATEEQAKFMVTRGGNTSE